MLSQELARLCSSELSVLPQRVWLVRMQGCKKEVFPAALREKSPHWVALSCDAHLLFAKEGKIRQPCTVSLSDSVSCEQFFIVLHFCAGNSVCVCVLLAFVCEREIWRWNLCCVFVCVCVCARLLSSSYPLAMYCSRSICLCWPLSLPLSLAPSRFLSVIFACLFSLFLSLHFSLAHSRAHAHTHIRAHTHAHARTRAHTPTHATTHTRTHTHTHTHKSVHARVCAFVRVCECVHVCMCACVCVCA